MINFKPLASSSAGCAYFLECEGYPSLMIDCGIGYNDLNIASGFTLTSFAGCLISHAHSDHCSSAKKLLQCGMECYASVETWEDIFDEYPIPVGAHFLDTFNLFKVGPWKVKCFEAVHDLPGTYGFYVVSPEGDNCLYLTDSQYSKHTFENLHYLFVEANFSQDILKENSRKRKGAMKRYSRVQKTHMSIENLIKMLKANDLTSAREIWLLHLSRTNSNEMKFIEQVQRATGVATYVAAEFSEGVK